VASTCFNMVLLEVSALREGILVVPVPILNRSLVVRVGMPARVRAARIADWIHLSTSTL